MSYQAGGGKWCNGRGNWAGPPASWRRGGSAYAGQDELPNAALLVVRNRERLSTLTSWTPNSIEGSHRHDITMFSQGNRQLVYGQVHDSETEFRRQVMSQIGLGSPS
jgi:hypothetical protein